MTKHESAAGRKAQKLFKVPMVINLGGKKNQEIRFLFCIFAPSARYVSRKIREAIKVGSPIPKKIHNSRYKPHLICFDELAKAPVATLESKILNPNP